MKRIGLIDVDGHNFQNLALMRISAYHKAKGALDGVTEEEQDAFDNMPEGPQNGDCGRVTAGITATTQAAEKPESGFTSTKRKDFYTDWLGTEAEARRFVEEARLA